MENQSDCPFKSPRELGLTDRQYSALVKTLLLMEAGKVIHIRDGYEKLKEGEYGFRMPNWHDRYPCGTVCCIGGTAELVEGLPITSLGLKAMNLRASGNNELDNLFYRWGGGSPSPEKAAKVLRGYLTTGKTEW